MSQRLRVSAAVDSMLIAAALGCSGQKETVAPAGLRTGKSDTGDLNRDGRTNPADRGILLGDFGRTP